MKSMKSLIPLILFAGLALLLYRGLSIDPKEIPSPFIDKPAPAFSLPQLKLPDQNLSVEDMRGQVWVLNAWASWCFACRAEHMVVTRLAQQHGAIVVGLNYKDERADALGWLARYGDPYVTSIVDLEGDIGIDYGVYGVPESFVIDKQGIIRHKVIGPITDDIVNETLLPLLAKLEAE